MEGKAGNYRIRQIIRNSLFSTFLIVFVLAVAVLMIETIIFSKRYSYNILESYVQDVADEADDHLHEAIRENTVVLTDLIQNHREHLSDVYLRDLADANPDIISEINIVDSNGIIQYSNIPQYIGFDLSKGEKSSEFLCLLNGTDYYEQDFRNNSFDNSTFMSYTGRAFYDGSGFLEVGISTDKYNALLEKTIIEEVRHRRIGLIGYIVVLNKDFVCIGSTGDDFVGRKLENTSALPTGEGKYQRTLASFNGEESFWVAMKKDGYYILGAFPVSESVSFEIRFIIMTIAVLIVMPIAMFIALRKKLDICVVKPIDEINNSLLKITGGDLDEKVSVNNSLEFEELSKGINQTVNRLKEMIAEADKLIAEELEMARVIQSTSLPGIFPPYPARKDIGLYATMNAAKQVGGDFYDYFMLNKNMLAVVIADVADKGIPAALYMMKAKTVLKAFAVSGRSLDEVVSMTNEELVKDKATMFVTLWIGFINLETGLLNYVHAGHTYPFVIRGNEILKIKQKRNFVVGGKSGVEFLQQEFQLLPGDTLYLYTDGVTEAKNKDKDEFKEERLKESLIKVTKAHENNDPNELCKAVCNGVLEDVRSFAGDAEQFDDITMLCFKFQPDIQD